MLSFAKITRPALSGVFPRERLFRRLGSVLLSHPVAWIAAPAGSGKTLLAASFVEARKAPCLWLRIDARDADPPSFFYYLRAAAGPLPPRRRETLPLLTPEYALDLEGYARSFFEQLGARLPAGAVIVLDDYHELPEDSPLQRLMPVALASLPESVRVLVASRATPPPAFARLVAHGRIACFGASELNLTDEETEELARVQRPGGLGAEAAAALRRRTGGWMAGTVLLLEGSSPERARADGIEPSAREVLFEYFAAEIFDRAPEQTRRFLLETALLPQVSVRAAVALTGEERSAEILSDLVRRNYFTVRLASAEPQVQYHPLFRAFLLARARATFGRDRWAAVARRAVAALRSDGAVEDAAALLIEVGEHATLAELVIDAAPALVRQGRLATVEGWLRALPADAREASPWLSYWLGVCRSPFAPADARPHLERAYRLFKTGGDVAGMLVAWSAYAKTFLYVWDQFAPLDRWIAELEDLRRHHPVFPSLEIEADVTFGMMGSLMWRQAGHPDVEAWVERAASFLHADLAPELRMQLASYVAFYRLWWKGDHAAAARLLKDMRPLLAAPDVSPQTEILWWTMEAAYRGRVGEREACYDAVERALATAERTGIAVQNLTLALQGVYGALASGDLAGAARYHERGRLWLHQDHATTAAHYHMLGTWIALAGGEAERAAAEARPMRERARLSGADFVMPWIGHTMAHLLVEQGRCEEALAVLERCAAWSRRTRNPLVEHHCALSAAHALLAAHREDEAVAALRQGFALGRVHGFVTHPWTGWRRDVAARLSALALERGVEVEHVRAQIRASALPAPASPPDAWPFPIRIRMLGAFELWRGDERIVFAGRSQRKPLELVQVLAALGGRDVREDAICEALWPDAEGDAAHHALETTLYRLRKLLGPGAVLQRDRRLSLDPATCWADVLAVERSAAAILRALDDPARDGADPDRRADRSIERDVERIVSLYRGPLLAADGDDLRWATVERERVRRVLARAAAALERHAGRGGLGHAAARLGGWLAEVDPSPAPEPSLAAAAGVASARRPRRA